MAGALGDAGRRFHEPAGRHDRGGRAAHRAERPGRLPAEVQWVVSGYALTFALALVTAGSGTRWTGGRSS
ncbi:hypothetical protein ACFQV4_30770 [Streptomyces thermocarboxydus]